MMKSHSMKLTGAELSARSSFDWQSLKKWSLKINLLDNNCVYKNKKVWIYTAGFMTSALIGNEVLYHRALI